MCFGSGSFTQKYLVIRVLLLVHCSGEPLDPTLELGNFGKVKEVRKCGVVLVRSLNNSSGSPGFYPLQIEVLPPLFFFSPVLERDLKIVVALENFCSGLCNFFKVSLNFFLRLGV